MAAPGGAIRTQDARHQLAAGRIPEAEMNVHDRPTQLNWEQNIRRRLIPRKKRIEVDVHSTTRGTEAIERLLHPVRQDQSCEGKKSQERCCIRISPDP